MKLWPVCIYLSILEITNMNFFPIIACKVALYERTFDPSKLNWTEVKAKLLPKTVEYVSQQSFMCWKDPHCKSLHPRTPALNQQQQLVRGFIRSHSNHPPWKNLLQRTVPTKPTGRTLYLVVVFSRKYKAFAAFWEILLNQPQYLWD